MFEFNSALNFMGEFDSTKNYKTGDVVLVNGESRLFTGTSWELLGKGGNDDTNKHAKTIIPKTCSQCGAPTKAYRTTCEYCGVSYI